MATQYSVKQLLAFEDRALTQFMIEARGDQNRFDISNITDWDHHAPNIEQRRLTERLIAIAPQAKASKALDYSQLVAKLQTIPQERELPSPEFKSSLSSSRPAGRSPTLSPEPGLMKEHQIRCYHWLVDAGGRPWCSLETLEKLYENPDAYVEMVRLWLGGDPAPSNPDNWEVFSRQLDRWKQFRRWQRDNRGANGGTGGSFAVFLDETRRNMKSLGGDEATNVPGFEEAVHSIWQNEQESHKRQRERIREIPNGDFAGYIGAARRRLARHGFVLSIQFLEDPKQQDERLTWIEYLEFECWWLDQFTECIKGKKSGLRCDNKGQCLKHKRAERRAAYQRLRVQWVLKQMPRAEEATAATLDTKIRDVEAKRLSQKRSHSADDDGKTGETTDKSMETPGKKQKQGMEGGQDRHGNRGTAQQGTKRKRLRPMVFDLETPVNRSQVQKKRRNSP